MGFFMAFWASKLVELPIVGNLRDGQLGSSAPILENQPREESSKSYAKT
jgi:hypothetical protein